MSELMKTTVARTVIIWALLGAMIPASNASLRGALNPKQSLQQERNLLGPAGQFDDDFNKGLFDRFSDDSLDEPEIDPVRVCVTYGNTPTSDFAWSVRADTQAGDTVAQRNGEASGECRVVDLEVGRRYYFRMFDTSGLGETSAYIENNGERIMELDDVPTTVKPIRFSV